MRISAQRIVFIMLVLLLCVQAVSAAKISGNVYDISLEKVMDVIIEIDTSPKQKFISKDGGYSFNVPFGSYTIIAGMYRDNLLEACAQEEITITEGGEYNVDLIIFPYIGDDENLINATDIYLPEMLFDDLDVLKNGYSTPKILIIIGFVLIILLTAILIGLWIMRKPKKALRPTVSFISITNELQNVVDIIKKEGGRTTQKEIRKYIPLSEAKISLMIAELEEKGILKKIKKGRGNIIILK